MSAKYYKKVRVVDADDGPINLIFCCRSSTLPYSLTPSHLDDCLGDAH